MAIESLYVVKDGEPLLVTTASPGDSGDPGGTSADDLNAEIAARQAADITLQNGKAATQHTHDATALVSGTIDPARLPFVPSQSPPVVSAGGIADLTQSQQNSIVNGTVVTTTDGRRFVYVIGTKTIEGNYIVLADITPEWGSIANKPAFGVGPGSFAEGNDARIVGAAQRNAANTFTENITIQNLGQYAAFFVKGTGEADMILQHLNAPAGQKAFYFRVRNGVFDIINLSDDLASINRYIYAVRALDGRFAIGYDGLTFPAQFAVKTADSNATGIVIQGAASQTAPLLKFQGTSNTGSARDAVSLDAVVTDTTDAGFSAKAVLSSAKNGVMAPRFEVDETEIRLLNGCKLRLQDIANFFIGEFDLTFDANNPIEINWNLGDAASIRLTGNCNLFQTNAINGRTYHVSVEQDNFGGHIPNFYGVVWKNQTAPVFTTTAFHMDFVILTWRKGICYGRLDTNYDASD